MGQVTRFFKAFSLYLHKDEVDLLRKYLNHQEQILFYRMPAVDQKHAVELAKLLEERIRNDRKVNARRLIKAGLLHDLGKCFYPFKLWERVAASLLKQFLLPVYDWLSEKGKVDSKNHFFRMIYVHKYHPVLGADLARETGIEEACCLLILNHQHRDTSNPDPELQILWEIDDEI